jgi:hypothetical protein
MGSARRLCGDLFSAAQRHTVCQCPDAYRTTPRIVARTEHDERVCLQRTNSAT